MSSLLNVLVALTLACVLTLSSSELLYCGNKYCGLEAECGRVGGEAKCACPLSQPMGDPAFRCHSTEKVSCVLVGDPSLLGFTGDLTFMDFPCKYTLSKFDTPLASRKHNNAPPADWSKADPGEDRCRVIIHGTNAITPAGSYYLRDVHITVNFNIGGSNKLETLVVNIHGHNATYSYPPYGDIVISQLEEHDCQKKELDSENSIGLTLCFTEATKMWTFGVDICGSTHINFRAWEGENENQPLRPGLSIITDGKAALFNNAENGYPSTMCDSPFNDADDVYHETCKGQGIVGKRNCALWAFLDNNPPMQPHYCLASIKLFKFCPSDRKVEAINACGSIVTTLAKCVLKNDKDVLNTFEACMTAVCADPSTCSTIKDYIHHGDEEDCNAFVDPC